QGHTCLRSIERCCPDGVGAGEVVQPLLIYGAAKLNLMRSLDPTEIVEDRRHWPVVLRAERCISSAECEGAGGGDCDHLTAERCDVRSEVGPVIVIVSNLHDVRPIGGDPERIDQVCAE